MTCDFDLIATCRGATKYLALRIQDLRTFKFNFHDCLTVPEYLPENFTKRNNIVKAILRLNYLTFGIKCFRN